MNKTNYLKSVYYDYNEKNIDALIEYLKKTGGKKLSTPCRRQNAFKTRWAQRDNMLINRCHLQNAASYLESIKTGHLDKQARVVVADIAPYVSALDANEDVSFILSSTNTLPSAIHFDIAKRLFSTHQIREQSQDNYSIDLLAIYALSLSLESRVRGFLGIDYATNNGKTIGLAQLIEVSKTLKSVTYSDGFNWTEVEWVNDWLNHHMHRHIRPFPWVIHQALETLEPFVFPKKPVFKESKTIHSFYSATYVCDEIELEKEIEAALKRKYPEIKIRWHSTREVLKP